MQLSLRGACIFPFFDHQVIAASSEREFTRNHFDEFLRQIRIDPGTLRHPKQVHKDEIIVVNSAQPFNPSHEADGIMTDEPGVTIGILTADCIPAFFWDPVQRVAALAHAGWRGLYAEILPKMVRKMIQDFDSRPSTIQVGIGPCIRRCCYEVGDEFHGYFPKYFDKPDPKLKARVDLVAMAKDQLIGEGIILNQIHDSKLCTSCLQDRFFCARRDKSDERILSVLQIR